MISAAVVAYPLAPFGKIATFPLPLEHGVVWPPLYGQLATSRSLYTGSTESETGALICGP